MKYIKVNKPTAMFLILTLLLFSLIFTSLSIKVTLKPNNSTDELIFSAETAYKHMPNIASKPHPRNSKEHYLVKEYIINTIESYGLRPIIQEEYIAEENILSKPSLLTNIMVKIEGTNSSGGVMIVAHYDSVPTSPGASDDGIAVASMLENIRLIKKGDLLKNDIIFLFTDGEEEGLLGAKKFVESHPLMQEVSFVINFEAKGTSGAMLMFETTQGDYFTIREFVKSKNKVISNSLLKDVYKMIPNDTDYTCFSNAKVQGLNFAFIGSPWNYHTMSDSLENISMDTFQQQGRIMQSLIKHYGSIDINNLQSTKNAIYFNFLNYFVVYSQFLSYFFMLVIVIFGVMVITLSIKYKYISISTTLIAVLVHSIIGVMIYSIFPYFQKFLALFSRELEIKFMSHTYSSLGLLLGVALLIQSVVTAIYSIISYKINYKNIYVANIIVWMIITLASIRIIPTGNYIFYWMTLLQIVVLYILIVNEKRQHVFSSNEALFTIVPVILLIPVYYPVITLAAQCIGAKNYKSIIVFIVAILGFIFPHLLKNQKRCCFIILFLLISGVSLLRYDYLYPVVDMGDPSINLIGGYDNKLRYIYDNNEGTNKWAIADKDIYNFIKLYDDDEYRIEDIEYGSISWVKDAPYLDIPKTDIEVIQEDVNIEKDLKTVKLIIKTAHNEAPFYIFTNNEDKRIKEIVIDNEYIFSTLNGAYINIKGEDNMTLQITYKNNKELNLKCIEIIDDINYIKDTEMFKKIKDSKGKMEYRIIFYDVFSI